MIVIVQNTIKMLFALVRSVIRGNQLSEHEVAIYSDEMLPDMMTISKKHDFFIWLQRVLIRTDCLQKKIKK